MLMKWMGSWGYLQRPLNCKTNKVTLRDAHGRGVNSAPRFAAQNGLDCGCAEASRSLQSCHTCPCMIPTHVKLMGSQNDWIRRDLRTSAPLSHSADAKTEAGRLCILRRPQGWAAGVARPYSVALETWLHAEFAWGSKKSPQSVASSPRDSDLVGLVCDLGLKRVNVRSQMELRCRQAGGAWI